MTNIIGELLALIIELTIIAILLGIIILFLLTIILLILGIKYPKAAKKVIVTSLFTVPLFLILIIAIDFVAKSITGA